MIFTVACVYWLISSCTNGEAFQYNEDVLLSEKVRQFKSYNNTVIESKYIEPLIKLYNPDDYTIRMGDSKEEMYTYITGDGLGVLEPQWVKYYYHHFLSKGYNFIHFECVETEGLYGDKTYSKIEVEVIKIPEEKIDRFSAKEYKTLNKEYSSEITDKETFYIWTDIINYEENFRIWTPVDFYVPLHIINNILSSSVNYIGEEYEFLKQVEDENLNYSYWDFLYFSVVTATTLGYGDILPNVTYVRVIVAIQTIVGVILIGVFVSQKFKEITDTNANTDKEFLNNASS